MLNTGLIHPHMLSALAAAGHGATILVADGNYPASVACHPGAERVYLNLRPGLVGCVEVLDAIASVIPLEAAVVMDVGDDRPEPSIWSEFRRVIPSIDIGRLDRSAFYDECRRPTLALSVITGEVALFANILLTIGT